MANVGTLNAQLGIDIGEFAKGLSMSIGQSRSWGKDLEKVFDATATNVQRLEREMSRLNIMKSMGLPAENYNRAVQMAQEQYGSPSRFQSMRASVNAGISGAFVGGRGMMTTVLGGGIAYSTIRAIRLGEEAVQSERKLAAVLYSTGNAAGFSSRELSAYATDLQRVTNFEDEATMGAMTVIAAFGSIRGDNFKRTTALAQDLATVMDIDLSTAATNLSRALAHPEQGMKGLGKMLSSSEVSAAKRLSEGGNLAEAQQVILTGLESRVGGAAVAAATPYTQLKNAISDVGEGIGKDLLPYVGLLKDELQAVTTAGIGGASKLQSDFGTAGKIVGIVADVIDVVIDSFHFAQASLTSFIAYVLDGFNKILELSARIPKIGEYIQPAADAARIMADEMHKGANTEWADAWKRFESKTPSERAAEAAARMAKAIDDTRKKGGFVGDIDTDAIDKANEGLDKIIETLKKEIGETGLSEAEKFLHKIDELSIKTDDPYKVQQARELAKQFERVKTLNDDIKRIKEIEKESRTPKQKLLDDAAEAQRLMERGLGIGSAGRFLAGSIAKMSRNAGTFEGLAPSLEVGSAEAYNALYRQNPEDPQRQMQETLLQMLAKQLDKPGLVDAIRTALQDLENAGVE